MRPHTDARGWDIGSLCRCHSARYLADAPLACRRRTPPSRPLLLTQRLLPLLSQEDRSFSQFERRVECAPKCGSFTTQRQSADALRDEVNPEGVRISSVFPGRTATARTRTLHEKEGRDFTPELLLQPEDVASVVLSILTLPWTAEVTNVSIRPMLKSY